MDKGFEIARGKTKVLHELVGQPDVAVITQSDMISAGNGARKDELPGKGRLAALTSSRIFRLLNLCGLPTHYLRGGEDDDGNEMLVRRCHMIPIEVVVRGVAAGSFVKRRPGVARGSLLIPRLIEFFFKDDARNDPLIEPDQIVADGLAHANEVATMSEIARIAFDILSHAWRLRDTLLVDLKIEFGRIASGEGKGNLVIADVIDNDSWRLWPQGREEFMLDKQLYRNLETVDEEGLRKVVRAYERVAEYTGSFPVMRPATVAIIGGEPVPEQSEPITRALAGYGIPMVRHVTSLTRTPGHVLSLVQQLDVAFSRLVFVAVGDVQFGQMVEFASASPVCMLSPTATPQEVDMLALRVAKAFALDDTVLYGRTLLTQGTIRAFVLQTDAQLNQPQQQRLLTAPT